MSDNENPVFFIPDTAKEVGEYRRKVLTEMPTLRDNFAMAALQGILNIPAFQNRDCEIISSMAYEFAEAMLRERDKPNFKEI